MVGAPIQGHNDSMEARQISKSNRLLLWMGLGLGMLVIAAAVVAVVRQPASFEPGTPEAVVQQYLEAVIAEEPEAAWALLTPRLQARCTVDDLERRSYRRDRGRIVLVDSSVRDETARIQLKFTAAFSDGAFGIDEYSHQERFDLRLVDGKWRISESPWPFYWCSEV